MYQQTGDLLNAGANFSKAADIAERTSGPDFATYWDIGANAARTLHLAGERDLADAQFEKVMPRLPPPSQHSIAATSVREFYGERLAAEGRPALAVPLLEVAEHDLVVHPRDDFDLRLVRLRLGDALARNGRTTEARSMLRKSLDDYVAHSKPDEQPLLAIRERWGRFLLDQGDSAEAAQQFEEIVRQAHERRLSHIALAHGDLARVALARRDIDVALTESAAALELWEHRRGFYDVRMGPYLQRIRADALAAAGRVEEAQLLEDAAWAASGKFDAPDSPTRLHRRLSPRSKIATAAGRPGRQTCAHWLAQGHVVIGQEGRPRRLCSLVEMMARRRRTAPRSKRRTTGWAMPGEDVPMTPWLGGFGRALLRRDESGTGASRRGPMFRIQQDWGQGDDQNLPRRSRRQGNRATPPFPVVPEPT